MLDQEELFFFRHIYAHDDAYDVSKDVYGRP